MKTVNIATLVTGVSSPKIYCKVKNYTYKRWCKYPHQLVKIDQSIMRSRKSQTKAREELSARGTIFTLHYNSQVSIYIRPVRQRHYVKVRSLLHVEKIHKLSKEL